ncbi:MAG: TlpA family protein disulfide reductase [Alphaproteobacteria bacterium]|nr:TlpA family protein disulfide reductase [Alphaproteobacteria bacterium]
MLRPAALLLALSACATEDPRVDGLEKRLQAVESEMEVLRNRVRNKQEIAEEAVVGKEAKLEVAEWMQGDATLADAKATMLVFWEVWCPHCKREVPELEKVYEEMHGDGLNIVGITRLTRNTTPEQLHAFLDEHHVTYPIARDDGAMGDLYAVSGVPAAALVKDGKIVWRGHPASMSREMLRAALGN